MVEDTSGTCIHTHLRPFRFLGLPGARGRLEPHPHTSEIGSFTNPDGIAVDEAKNGDVYVADIATTNAVYPFNANGTPVNFSFPAGSKEALGNTLYEGADTPAESFSFPSLYGSPGAIAVVMLSCQAHQGVDRQGL